MQVVYAKVYLGNFIIILHIAQINSDKICFHVFTNYTTTTSIINSDSQWCHHEKKF